MAILLTEVLVGPLECELLIRAAFFWSNPSLSGRPRTARLGRLPTASGSGGSIQVHSHPVRFPQSPHTVHFSWTHREREGKRGRERASERERPRERESERERSPSNQIRLGPLFLPLQGASLFSAWSFILPFCLFFMKEKHIPKQPCS